MRTLLQLTMNPSNEESDVHKWLESAGFRPQHLSIDDALKKALLEHDQPEHARVSDLDIPSRHGFELFCSIPLAEQERDYAHTTAKFVLRFDDQHGNTAWGLVCVDSPTISIRWRH